MENNNTTALVIKQVVAFWESRNAAYTNYFNQYAEESYSNEIAPGRNRAIYLLAHLIATNDGMRSLLGLGEPIFPELTLFSRNPDKSFEVMPSLSELKSKWSTLNAQLNSEFAAMTTEQWLEKHTAVSAEDFAKDPLRNKLNILINRTNHQSYHLGQLNLLYAEVLTA